jgi:hypothetical protein
MQLKRPVTLKVIVTDEFKKELGEELQDAIARVEAAQQQIEFQSRRYMLELQKTNLNQAMAVRQQFEAEKQKQENLKTELTQQLVLAKELELGSEFARGTLEGQVEIQVGDNLFNRLSKAEIVIKDGLVQEIREGERTSLLRDYHRQACE